MFYAYTRHRYQVNAYRIIGPLVLCGFVMPPRRQVFLSRKRLRTKVTPDFQLTYSKKWEIWGRNQNDKNG